MRKKEIEFGIESVGDEGKIQIKDFDVEPVPNLLAELVQVGKKDRGGGGKSNSSGEQKARERA